MSEVMNLMPVVLPRFMGASASKQQNQSSDPQVALSAHNWGNYSTSQPTNQSQEDSFDFDLLAEYLLDDGTAGSSPDFGINVPLFATTTTNQTLNPHDGSVSASLPDVSARQPPKTVPAPYAPQSSGHQFYSGHVPAPRPSPAPNAPLMPNVLPAPVPNRHPISATPAPQSIAPVTLNHGRAPPIVTNPNKRPRHQAPASVTPPATINHSIGNGTVNFPPSFTQKGRPKSQAQIDRRRERNRILARRTRLRKKFFFESLQKDVMDLQQENMILKEIVRSRVNSKDAKLILDSCNANEQLPSCVIEQCGDMSNLDKQDFNLIQSIQKSQQCFVITDPSLQDNPIVYASQDFLSLTGYARDDVLGRNCRFLQGPETSQVKIKQIREAVTAGSDVTVTFVNYTADGTPFWNKLFIAALRDAQNNIVNFIGVTVKVAGPEAGDIEEGKKLQIEAPEDNDTKDCDENTTLDDFETDVPKLP